MQASSNNTSDRQKVIIHPPTPHSKKQALMCQFFLMPGVEELWVACGTKFGKSIGLAGGMCNGAIVRPRTIWRWIAPLYLQSRIGFEYCKSILPKPPHAKINEGKLTIQLEDAETQFAFYHSANPESLEGYGISGYVFDEAAKIKEEAYASAKTTRTVTRGPMAFCSTPRGKNWFYRGCMNAREEMLRAQFEKRTPTKIFISALTSDNPFVPQSSIDEARRDLPDRLFRQYYLAEFVDDGGVFLGFKECFDGSPITLYGEHQRWVHETAKESAVVIGADWGKTVDYTVFTAIDMKTRRLVGFERFHRRPYTESIKMLVRFSRKFKDVEVVLHDKTGVGVAIDDQLAYTTLPFRGVTFTNSWKNQAVTQLMTSFEQKRIILPHWNMLESELDSFEVETTPSGAMKYGAAHGHDDIVCSLLLAHCALIEYGEDGGDIVFFEDLGRVTDDDGKTPPSSESSLESFYNDISDDEDD